jgi:predicted GTPase
MVYVLDAQPGRINKSINYIKTQGYDLKSKLKSDVPELYVATKMDLLEEDDKASLEAKLTSELPGKQIIPVSNSTGVGIGNVVYAMETLLNAYHKVPENNGTDLKLVSKVSVCGTGGAGKTTLIDRIITGQFVENQKMTIGIEFKLCKLTQCLEDK